MLGQNINQQIIISLLIILSINSRLKKESLLLIMLGF